LSTIFSETKKEKEEEEEHDTMNKEDEYETQKK
jgi:hypothetical protein